VEKIHHKWSYGSDATVLDDYDVDVDDDDDDEDGRPLVQCSAKYKHGRDLG